MSIQEKKSIKGTPFAIVKFSDKFGEFELFLFSDNLISNRDKLKEAESFVLTIQKDKATENSPRRVNVKKIIPLDELVNYNYKNVSIEVDEKLDFKEFKKLLNEKGDTEIKLILNQKNKKITFKLENPRKFDLKLFNKVKNNEYVKKITF